MYILDTDGISSEDCNCTDSYMVSIYSQDLSYASLSLFSVNQILEGSRNQISESYIEALHTAERISTQMFSETVKKLEDTVESIQDVLKLPTPTYRILVNTDNRCNFERNKIHAKGN